MLPFLKNKQDATAGSESAPVMRKHDESAEFDALELAAEDLNHALQSKNYKAAAQALRAAFEIFESEPHEEGSHE